MAQSVVCQHCGDMIDPEAAGSWREVTAWVQARKGGGSNQARDQKPTGNYACKFCIDTIRSGRSVGQGQML